jgi:hypothetical protein
MDMADIVQEQAIRLLEETLAELNGVFKRLQVGNVDSVELVAMLESLSLRDQQRAQLLDQARIEASATRRRDEERSIRQFVLHALEEIGAPQTAGFLEDYVYARERVLLSTRGFGALRRDENRAWMRRPGHRRAYIVPCLNEAGRAVPRWMARSDWPMEERVFVPGVDQLWSWTRVLALVSAFREEDDEAAGVLYLPFVHKYAGEARGDETESELEREGNWLLQAEEEATHEVERLRGELAKPRAKLAEDFADLDAEQQLWGVTTVSRRMASGRAEDADAD